MESLTNPVEEKKFFIDGVQVTKEESAVVTPPEDAIDLTPEELADMTSHTITQEDIDNNPGIGDDLEVGDEVFLPQVDFGADAPSDAAPEASN